MPDGTATSPEADTIYVDQPVIACDGGAPPLGHPRVFLRLVDGGAVCPYCSRQFRLKPGAGHGGAH